jgi:hypothetical protein
MNKIILLVLVSLVLAACGPFNNVVQNAIAETETAQPTGTMAPTQTPYFVTKIVIQTPQPVGDYCKPITGVDYSDMSNAIVKLQAYMLTIPGVKNVSYAIPEKLYSNANSEIIHMTYVSTDGNVYSSRYIIYLRELGWKPGIFSIEGQCWIDAP